MPLSKPEFEDIKKLYDALKGDWSELHAQDEEMLKLWDMTYDVPHAEPAIENFTPKIIRSGWTRRAIKAFVSLFDKPTFRHSPGIGAPSHRISERIEGFLNAFLWAVEARFGAFWKPSVEDAGKLGRGWVEVLPKRKRWAESESYPRKGKGTDPNTGKPVPENEGEEAYKKRREQWKKEELAPISIRHLSSESVKALITERYRVLRAVRYVEVSLAEAASRWPEHFKEHEANTENDPTDTVECYEYVDEEWVAQAASYKEFGTLLKPGPYRHHMKICPWVLIEALTTSSSEPAKRWEPLLLEIKDVGIQIDALLTKKASQIQMWPFPLPVIEDPNLNSTTPEKGWETLKISPPDALLLYGGKKLHIEGFQGYEPQTTELLEELHMAKDRSLPDVGSEIAEGASSTAAWTWRLRGDMQERDMKSVADNLSLSAKRIGQAVLRAIQSRWIDETVYIGKEGEEGVQPERLSPKDIEGQVDRIDATVKSSKITDRNSDLGAMKMAVEEPLKMGRRFAFEHYGDIENAQEVIDESLLEEIEFSQPMIQQLAMDIMERADILEQRESRVPPGEVARLMPLMPPGVQAAVRNVQMQGLGASGVPLGAHPNTLTRTGAQTAMGGPKPTAPGPGEAEVMP